MGAPARVQDRKQERVGTPDLRVLRGTPKRTRVRDAATVSSISIAIVICFVALTIFGLGRIWLSSQATQAVIQSSQIKSELREARALSDELEIKHSFLSRSDRIRAYAQGTLLMGPAENVGHIDLSPEVSVAVAELPDSAFADATVQADMGGLMQLVAALLPESETGAGVVSAP